MGKHLLCQPLKNLLNNARNNIKKKNIGINMVYPDSTPEFRIFIKCDGTQELQVRYINIAQGYTGKWQPIKVEYENA
jgi:hypothetical protein